MDKTIFCHIGGSKWWRHRWTGGHGDENFFSSKCSQLKLRRSHKISGGNILPFPIYNRKTDRGGGIRPPPVLLGLRCGPDNKRTKEKGKTIKIKEKNFEKQKKFFKNFLSLTFFSSNIFCLTFLLHLWAPTNLFCWTFYWTFLPSPS